MSRYLALGLLCIVLGAPAPAAGQTKTPPEIPAALRDHLLVFTNARGRYLVVPHMRRQLETQLRNKIAALVFFGDAKAIYKQRISGYGSVRADGSFHLYISELRTQVTRLQYVPTGGTHIVCDAAKVPLSPLTAERARTFLGKVALRPYFWRHEPHLLARDEEGRYFYLDRAATATGGRRRKPSLTELRGFRLWIGRRGHVKPVKLRDAVIDEAGQIFLTKQGALHVDAKQSVFWRQGKQRAPLVSVPIFNKLTTRLLIHKHLGAYASVRFNTPCDGL